MGFSKTLEKPKDPQSHMSVKQHATSGHLLLQATICYSKRNTQQGLSGVARNERCMSLPFGCLNMQAFLYDLMLFYFPKQCTKPCPPLTSATLSQPTPCHLHPPASISGTARSASGADLKAPKAAS